MSGFAFPLHLRAQRISRQQKRSGRRLIECISSSFSPPLKQCWMVLSKGTRSWKDEYGIWNCHQHKDVDILCTSYMINLVHACRTYKNLERKLVQQQATKSTGVTLLGRVLTVLPVFLSTVCTTCFPCECQSLPWLVLVVCNKSKELLKRSSCSSLWDCFWNQRKRGGCMLPLTM